MKQRNSEHFPERNKVKVTLAEAGTVTPDLKIANVYRIDGTIGDLVVATPENPRDGQYLRVEATSIGGKKINFGIGYHVNGAVIADGSHTSDMSVVYEGWYNADTSKWNMIKLSDLAGSTATDILTFILAEQTGAATVDAGAHTVAIEVEVGTVVTALEPTITLSAGASVSPLSGVATDFTAAVDYTVTAEDGSTTQVWAVTVTVAT